MAYMQVVLEMGQSATDHARTFGGRWRKWRWWWRWRWPALVQGLQLLSIPLASYTKAH